MKTLWAPSKQLSHMGHWLLGLRQYCVEVQGTGPGVHARVQTSAWLGPRHAHVTPSPVPSLIIHDMAVALFPMKLLQGLNK